MFFFLGGGGGFFVVGWDFVEVFFRGGGHFFTVWYSTVLYSTVQYSTVQYNTIQYNTVQYSTVQYSTVQYSTVQYSTVQYSTVQYSTQYTVQYSPTQPPKLVVWRRRRRRKSPSDPQFHLWGPWVKIDHLMISCLATLAKPEFLCRCYQWWLTNGTIFLGKGFFFISLNHGILRILLKYPKTISIVNYPTWPPKPRTRGP